MMRCAAPLWRTLRPARRLFSSPSSSSSRAAPAVKCFFHKDTNTCTYLVWDQASRRCAVVDPVLDFNLPDARTSTRAADEVIGAVKAERLSLDWILESHVHADHLSAAHYLKQQLGGRIAIGARVRTVQTTFRKLFNLPAAWFSPDGFDVLFEDEATFGLGSLPCRVLHTPGHTPACVAYHIGDAAFTGDTIFMPDYGTARCDFPGGSASDLYASIRTRLFSLPDATRLFVGHDYLPPGGPRTAFAWESTVAAQRSSNIHVGGARSEAEFVALRRAKDATLGAPRLLLPSLQVNLRAGQLPPAEDNGVAYLKLPINAI